MSAKYIKILLLEDDPAYTRLLQKMLAVAGRGEYQIECVDRLSTGLEYLAQGEYDVVLLDLGLPDSQGLDTLDKVCARIPAVPIVVMTGIEDETLAVQAIRQGAQDYLVKGDIDSRTLQRVLRYAIERKQAEDLLRSLILSSPVGIYIVQDGRFKFVNPQFQKDTGYNENELLGMDSLSLVVPGDREMVRGNAVGMLKGERSVPYEYRVTTRAGDIKWVLEIAASIKYGGTRATLGYFMDTSERRKIQLQMAKAEKMSAVGMMAAGVAHELLNPMMGMLNFAQYCLKHTAEDDRRYPVLQGIERETGRCADIVRNLMTFSHRENEAEEEYQLESFTTIIDRVVKLLSYRIEKDHVLLTRHIAEGTPRILMAVNGMQQVLLNLVSNALDALAESQRKEIHLELHREGDFVQLTVADSGCGIAPEILEKIYEPFFTTKPVGRGTGLGLTISRNIINSLGGDIACQSQPGVGTTFTIILPLERKGGTK
ncbi:MAG: PAS domain S-box protein [Chloroflexi bacterium]|nr:PAS domain S-box protein [Chloroflexota bacterium]